MTNVKAGNKGRLGVAAVLAAGLVLSGCQGSGQGAAIGGGIGAGLGCGIGAAVTDSNPAAGCLIGGLIGGLTGAFIGDAIEAQQQRRVVYMAARSGGSASSGTFRNSKGQRVAYRARVNRTYKQERDPGLSCRDIEVVKTVDGAAGGSRSVGECQVRVAGKPTWQQPEA